MRAENRRSEMQDKFEQVGSNQTQHGFRDHEVDLLYLNNRKCFKLHGDLRYEVRIVYYGCDMEKVWWDDKYESKKLSRRLLPCSM